jgi:drug/metabolite transporter (DMT)-like permease
MTVHEDSKPPRSVFHGRLLVIAAAVLWSTSGFFAKAPIFDGWDELSRGPLLAFWRATFASLILVMLVRRVSWSWRMVPMLLAFVVMNWTYLSALVLCESAMAIWLQYIAPAWAFLMGWWLFKERPARHDWVLLTFVIVALLIILSAGFAATPLGIVYGVISGVCFAAVVVMLRWNNDADPAWLVFINHAATAIVFLPYLIQSDVYPVGSQWGYLAAFGMFQMGLPYFLLARALKGISSHEASGLTLLEPVLVPVWVWIAWRNSESYQAPAVTTIVGGLLILVGLLIRYRKPRSVRAAVAASID